MYYIMYVKCSIGLSEKFLFLYKKIIDAWHFCFVLFYWITHGTFFSIKIFKDHNIWQISFRVCVKMRCCERHVCKRKTLFRQANASNKTLELKRGANFAAISRGTMSVTTHCAYAAFCTPVYILYIPVYIYSRLKVLKATSVYSNLLGDVQTRQCCTWWG